MGSTRGGKALAALAGALLVLALPNALAAEPAPAPDAAAPEPARTLATGEGAKVTSFFFGPSDRITPLPPYNETRAQTKTAFGVAFPRSLISNVGTWSAVLSEEGMIVESLDGLSIWASSDQGAVNVRFTVLVEINGNTVATLNTETKAALAVSPEEFRIDPGSSSFGVDTFPKGSQLSFALQYRSSSARGPIGPSADSTIHYYSNLYRSRIDFITNPFNLTVSKVDIAGGHVNVTSIVKDAFGLEASQKVIALTFNGPTNSVDRYVEQVTTLVDPINGTTVVWNWHYAQQGGVSSGSYIISLSGRYVGSETNYSSVSSEEMKFPQHDDAGKGLLPGPGAAASLAALAAVAVAAAVHGPPTRSKRR